MKESREPCPRCWEPILPEATVCPHCRSTVVFDLSITRKVGDSRTAYHAARSLEPVSGQPLDFLSLKKSIEDAPGIVVPQVSRAVATECLERLEEHGIPAELVAHSGPGDGAQVLSRRSVTLFFASVPEFIRGRPGTAFSLIVALVLTAASLHIVIRNREPKNAGRGSAIPMQELAALAERTTVRLHCGEQIGAGFLVSKDLVVTNEHVLCSDKQQIEVTFIDGRTTEGRVVKRDEWLDAALVQIEESSDTFLRLADASTLERGDEVFLMGSPRGMDFSFSQGIISHPNRALMGLSYLQIDAGVNPGNSGGPLLDNRGNAVGIVSMMVGSSDNLGLALPVNYLLEGVNAILPEADVAADRLRWEKRVASAAESNRKDVDEARAELAHAGLMEANLYDPTGLVAVVARWSNSQPGSEHFNFELRTRANASCTPSGDAVRWRKTPLGSEQGLDSRYVIWLEKHRLMRDMYVTSFRLDMSGCPRPSALVGATLTLIDGNRNADRAIVVRRPL